MAWFSLGLKKQIIDMVFKEYQKEEHECYLVYQDENGLEHKLKYEPYIDGIVHAIDFNEEGREFDEVEYETIGYSIKYVFDVPKGAQNVYGIHDGERTNSIENYPEAGTFTISIFSIE